MLKLIHTLLLFVFVTLFSLSATAAETTVKFAIGEWEPYTGESIADHGMATELVTAACKAAGLTAEYSFVPWKRAENNVLTAKDFGTFPYKEIAERSDKYIFSDTLFSNSFGILMSKNNKKTETFEYSKIDDLKNFKVGIIAGTDAIKNALKAIGVEAEEAQTAKQNLQKLEAGRIDFYIDDKAVIYQAIKVDYPADKAGEFVFSKTDFGDKNDWKIMVSKEYPNGMEILGKINAGLSKIKETGEYNAILGKYGI